MPIVECQICKDEFYVKPSHQKLGWGKYCSIKCRTNSQKIGEKVSCLICKKAIYRSPRQIKDSQSGNFFCDKSCQTKWKNSNSIGKKHPNWKTGIRSYREILSRKNKKEFCFCCNLKDKRVLLVHHIDQNRKNNDVSNLVWVCHNCHHLIHYYNKYKNKLKNKHGVCSSVG